METRKIAGFNDECEFNVVDEKIIISDNGPLYKNKLRNGLSLDTLCWMEFTATELSNDVESDIINLPIIIKSSTDFALDENTELLEKNIKKTITKKVKTKKIKNGRDEKKRNKQKMLKNGHDYKMQQYQDDGIDFPKVVKTIVIPKNRFKHQEIEKYAPICDKCYTYAMISKKYFMLYKCSYLTKFCNHVKCWCCMYQWSFIYGADYNCCHNCMINKKFDVGIEFVQSNRDGYYRMYFTSVLRKYNDYRLGCNCRNEYGDDYGKKYKCGQVSNLEFSYYTYTDNNTHLDQNGNTIIQLHDENIFEKIMSVEDIIVYDDNFESTEIYEEYDFH